MKNVRLYSVLAFLVIAGHCVAQQADSSKKVHHYKNVIRYNLSGALLFGIDKYIVFGYERVISPRQSFSINMGRVSLPKLINISTDSFSISKDKKRTGFNVSVDYRFYLAKENKYDAPHGLYIGPYYSFNHFEGTTEWAHKNNSSSNNINTSTDFNIHVIGFELGYQFILWKRLALDFVMIGPGMGFYNYKAKFDANLDAAKREQLLEALKQLLTQKFPGMNYAFSDKEFDSNGTIKTNTIGYRYIIHIGFNF